MRDVVRQALLLDFYGALLTEKQREIYDWYYQQDLSLGEISDAAGVSRNAVHDLLRRVAEKLERYDQALGLLAVRERQEADKQALAADFTAWLAAGAPEPGQAAAANQRRDEFQALLARLREL
jgi:predicted DNA-binding protein YlxM (UPF0122 family)